MDYDEWAGCPGAFILKSHGLKNNIIKYIVFMELLGGMFENAARR